MYFIALFASLFSQILRYLTSLFVCAFADLGPYCKTDMSVLPFIKDRKCLIDPGDMRHFIQVMRKRSSMGPVVMATQCVALVERCKKEGRVSPPQVSKGKIDLSF